MAAAILLQFHTTISAEFGIPYAHGRPNAQGCFGDTRHCVQPRLIQGTVGGPYAWDRLLPDAGLDVYHARQQRAGVAHRVITKLPLGPGSWLHPDAHT